MELFTGKNRGAISVFLCLVLLPVLVFCGIIVDASRLFASKTVVSAAGDLTMNAALSAYDKDLKDKYGLLAMADKPEAPETKEKLLQYFRESCNGVKYLEKDAGEDEIHSMIQLEVADKDFQIKGVENSSLGQYNVLEQQMIEYMKFRGPVYMVDDILKKFKELPLDKMKEKQDYVKKKSEYGKQISKLGKPLKKAKEKIDKYNEAWSNLLMLIEGDAPEVIDKYKNKIVFWLAGKSLDMYFQGYDLAVPWDDRTYYLPQETDRIKEYINNDMDWDKSETEFKQNKYDDIMAAIFVYRQKNSLESGITEENGFSEEDIQKFENLGTVCYYSIEAIYKIYEEGVEEYLNSCKELEKELKSEINSMLTMSQQAQDALDEAKKQYEEAEKIKKQYESLGEKLDIEDEVEAENVNINIHELEDLKLCLERNQKSVECMGNKLEQKISAYQNVPVKISDGGLNSIQAGYLSVTGNSKSVVESLLSEKGIYWESLRDEDSLCDPCKQPFYTNTLSQIGKKTENNEAKEKQKQVRNEAKEKQKRYTNALNAIQNMLNAKDLSSEEIEKETGFLYPEDYPGSGKSVDTDNITKKVEVNGDGIDDNSIVKDSVDNMGLNGIEGLVNAMDTLAGVVLEKAYIMEYITEMFNCYTTGIEKNDAKSLSGESLSDHYIQCGEMEYILYGSPKTAGNVAFAVSQTFAIRLVINSVYIFLDKDENKIANIIAAGISESTGSPWLYPIIKYGYLFCRALNKSGEDIGNLVEGKAVKVTPDSNFTLTYKEYLKLYILCNMLSDEGEKDIVMRAADCIQLNTKSRLFDRYTMVVLKAKVKSSTTFLPKVPAFFGEKEKETDGKKSILYRSVLAY